MGFARRTIVIIQILITIPAISCRLVGGKFKIAHLFLTGYICYSSLFKIGLSGRLDRTEIELANSAC